MSAATIVILAVIVVVNAAWIASIIYAWRSEVPVHWRIGVHATGLPGLHNDPFDRIIIATAQIGGMRIITPDGLIRAYPDTSICW